MVSRDIHSTSGSRSRCRSSRRRSIIHIKWSFMLFGLALCIANSLLWLSAAAAAAAAAGSPAAAAAAAGSPVAAAAIPHAADTAAAVDIAVRQLKVSKRLSDVLLEKYLTNEQLAAWVDEYVHRCSTIARKLSIGKSVAGFQLWAIEISSTPGVPGPKPNYKYIANMHGNEPSGRVLLPMLAEWLCDNNGRDGRATRLIKGMHLFIIPTMNPDGFALKTRENKNRVDLNRNFPDPITRKGKDLTQPLPNAALETIAIMNFTNSRKFVGSANLHEGAVVANYPYDGFPDGSTNNKQFGNPTPDDATFQFLAQAYAKNHAFMSKSQEFPDGIVNGAFWYPVYGGMQDWNYMARDCLSITLELSDTKWRPEQDLKQLWQENRDALIALPTAAALAGVRGSVVSAADNSPVPATIVVKGINHNITAEKQFGFYVRALAPGKYTLQAAHPSYKLLQAQVEVPPNGEGAVLNFKLEPLAAADGLGPGPRDSGTGRLVRSRGYDRGGGGMYVVGAHLLIVGFLVALFLCQGAGVPRPRSQLTAAA